MPQSKSDWCFVLFILMTILIISLNELGYGVISLLLLLPTCLLMRAGMEEKKPND